MNLLGGVVAKLVDDVLDQGKHTVYFDANKYHCTSGVYFYVLKSGSTSISKKMILIK
jgi:hypothetical protein